MENPINTSLLKKLLILVVIGISANLLFVFFSSEQSILSSINALQWYHYMGAVCCVLLYWLGHGCRISLWSKFVKHPIPLIEGVRIASYTDLGAAVSPTLVGGGPIKLGMLLQKGMKPGKAGFLTVLGGIEDGLMYLSAFVLTLLYASESTAKIRVSAGQFFNDNALKIGIILVAFIVYKLLSQKITQLQLRHYIPYRFKKSYIRFVQGFNTAMKDIVIYGGEVIRRGKLRFILSFSILLIQWLAKFTILIIIFNALSISNPFFDTYVKEWIVQLSMMLFPTPGATGGAEILFYKVFEDIISENILSNVTALWRFGTYYLFLFMALLVLYYNLIFSK